MRRSREEPVPLGVRARPNEDPAKLIKRFTKKIQDDGILREVFMRRAYEKPSVKRRRKLSRAKFFQRTRVER